MISSIYSWLNEVPDLPKMVKEALAIGKLNTAEIPGHGNNPVIMSLAKEAGVASIYPNDETAWCAVAQTAIALRAGKVVPFKDYDRLRASSFAKFGNPVPAPMLGDTLVFKRLGGYHVGLYIGEDDTHFHVAGGNQGNQYSIVRIEKSRLFAARRPVYSVAQPASVKQIFLSAHGVVSQNEA